MFSVREQRTYIIYRRLGAFARSKLRFNVSKSRLKNAKIRVKWVVAKAPNSKDRGNGPHLYIKLLN
jgi:hypothetical protein